ncbi:hypothetical protein [Paenibacillus sp. NPDC058071]|uniref:hypothetical protein n=1 Tax=Paenibacillus sp. NPDC058071 TaxID=3346326 RepID=UPI0036DDABE6
MKKWIKQIVDVAATCAIGFVLYVGYFIFFDKPAAPAEITSLYLKMSYAFVVLFIVLIIRVLLNKGKEG